MNETPRRQNLIPNYPVHRDGVLAVDHYPGTGDAAAVVFTGAPMREGMPKPEFIGAAADDGRRHVILVRDLTRSWFSAEGLRDKIITVTRGLLDKLAPRHVFTLGNSMGGHGALVFAGPLRANSVIAFTPQFSMHPDMMDEPRWGMWRPSIINENLATVGQDWRPGTRSWVLAAHNMTRDIGHIRQISRAIETRVLILRRGGHNPARLFRRMGILPAVIEALAYEQRVPMALRHLFRLVDLHHPLTRLDGLGQPAIFPSERTPS